MNVPIKNRFAELLARKSDKEQRFIGLGEVATATGVSRKTLYKWEKNQLTRFDTEVVDALCSYFGVGFTELLTHTPPDESQTKKKTARK